MAKNKLTEKQKCFTEEYLVDLNATQAAIRAGYSKKTANRIGSENLSKPVIQAAIAKAMEERSKRTEITQDRVLQELGRLAFLDPRKFFDENGHLKEIKDLDDDSAAALASMEIDVTVIDKKVETATAKIKFWDKSKNLNGLAKHFGMFKEDNKQKTPDGIIPITVEYVDAPPREGEDG